MVLMHGTHTRVLISFVINGYVVVAFNDKHVDMSFYRNFSDATGHDGEYLWMSQPADLPPYNVAVLKSNNVESVFFYEWPSLKLKQDKRIPLPPKAIRVLPEYVYDSTGYYGMVMVFGQFQMTTSGHNETGVVYIQL